MWPIYGWAGFAADWWGGAGWGVAAGWLGVAGRAGLAGVRRVVMVAAGLVVLEVGTAACRRVPVVDRGCAADGPGVNRAGIAVSIVEPRRLVPLTLGLVLRLVAGLAGELGTSSTLVAGILGTVQEPGRLPLPLNMAAGGVGVSLGMGPAKSAAVASAVTLPPSLPT
jgi:hypothetical protein